MDVRHSRSTVFDALNNPWIFHNRTKPIPVSRVHFFPTISTWRLLFFTRVTAVKIEFMWKLYQAKFFYCAHHRTTKYSPTEKNNGRTRRKDGDCTFIAVLFLVFFFSFSRGTPDARIPREAKRNLCRERESEKEIERRLCPCDSLYESLLSQPRKIPGKIFASAIICLLPRALTRSRIYPPVHYCCNSWVKTCTHHFGYFNFGEPFSQLAFISLDSSIFSSSSISFKL